MHYSRKRKGYDSESLREHIRDTGDKPNIPRKNNSQKGNDDKDWCLYKWWHLVENAFARIKHFRAIATRYDKLLRNYARVLVLALSMMWLPMWSDFSVNNKDQQPPELNDLCPSMC